jgi:hypothetical protein
MIYFDQASMDYRVIHDKIENEAQKNLEIIKQELHNDKPEDFPPDVTPFKVPTITVTPAIDFTLSTKSIISDYQINFTSDDEKNVNNYVEKNYSFKAIKMKQFDNVKKTSSYSLGRIFTWRRNISCRKTIPK